MSHGLYMSNLIGEAVLHHAEKYNARFVTEVQIRIGKLACFSKRQIESYLSMRFEETVAEGARILITEVTPRIFCTECKFIGDLQGIQRDCGSLEYFELKCPNCGGTNVDLKRGRELELNQIKIIE